MVRVLCHLWAKKLESRLVPELSELTEPTEFLAQDEATESPASDLLSDTTDLSVFGSGVSTLPAVLPLPMAPTELPERALGLGRAERLPGECGASSSRSSGSTKVELDLERSTRLGVSGESGEARSVRSRKALGPGKAPREGKEAGLQPGPAGARERAWTSG